MSVVLAILSVLAVWSLLAVLIVGLLLIRKTLESVRVTLERVAMGVRAIEKETEPLGPRALRFIEHFTGTLGHLAALPDGLTAIDRELQRIGRIG
jgi:uncharacterized protein YoxC